MHYTNPKPQRSTRTILFVALALIALAGIIYMKYATDSRKADATAAYTDSAAAHIAIPDTTVDPTLRLAPEVDSVTAMPADTLLGKDKRSPFEAGYEDGYAAGCDDGATHQERATYDETNNFRNPRESRLYVDGYREGYAKGFADGQEGKQFNI